EQAITRWENNTGVTTQANVSLDNTYFLTGGVRVEHDSRLPSSGLVSLPMLGLATVTDYGPFTVKLRGAYGQGVRPLSTFAHFEAWQGSYGSSQGTLGPERQAGTELGVDVLMRRSMSLRITRFDQRASGLIQQVALPADPDPGSRRLRYELENVGVISNRG